MNEGYTQQELLLLSNFVYIPACLSDRPIKDVIDSYRDASGNFTEESVASAAAGGGMSCADVCTVFDEMDKVIKKDPGFGEISASRRLEAEDVRAVCYTDKKDENPVVVFRGTGGTKEAWTDNFEGAYLEDTRIQHIADEFVKNECAIYDEVVVTGHSKGGNLAQYVTVKENAKVSGCLSFDGQGFGDDFIRSNSDDVAKASPKICSVCAYNDFVGILLTSIAGRCIYVANEASLSGAHSSVTLLTNNTFDEDGNFISIRPQSAICAQLDRITDGITDALDPFPVTDKKAMSTVAGLGISSALTTPKENLAEQCLAPTLGAAAAELEKRFVAVKCLLKEADTPVTGSVSIDTALLEKAAKEISSSVTGIKRVLSEVDMLRQDLAVTISSKICGERALQEAVEDLEAICERMDRYAQTLAGVCRCYTNSESRALSLMGI